MCDFIMEIYKKLIHKSLVTKFRNQVLALIFSSSFIVGTIFVGSYFVKERNSIPSGDICVHIDMKKHLLISICDDMQVTDINEQNFCNFLSELVCIAKNSSIKAIVVNIQEGLNISMSRIIDLCKVLEYIKNSNKIVYIYMDSIDHIGMLLLANACNKIYMNIAGNVYISAPDYFSNSFENFITKIADELLDSTVCEEGPPHDDTAKYVKKAEIISQIQNKALYKCINLMEKYIETRKIDKNRFKYEMSANEAKNIHLVDELIYDIDEIFNDISIDSKPITIISFQQFSNFLRINAKKMFKIVAIDDKNHETSLKTIKKMVKKHESKNSKKTNYIIRISTASTNPTISRKIVYFISKLPKPQTFISLSDICSIIEFNIASHCKQIEINDFSLIYLSPNGLSNDLYKTFVKEIAYNLGKTPEVVKKSLLYPRLGYEYSNFIQNQQSSILDVMQVEFLNVSSFHIFKKYLKSIFKFITKINETE